jgi:hypothetical protein
VITLCNLCVSLSSKRAGELDSSAAAVDGLRQSHEHLVLASSADDRSVSETPGARSPLFRGLEPHPDNGRAKVPKPTLPHFAIVRHRRSYPDGSQRLRNLSLPGSPRAMSPISASNTLFIRRTRRCFESLVLAERTTAPEIRRSCNGKSVSHLFSRPSGRLRSRD